MKLKKKKKMVMIMKNILLLKNLINLWQIVLQQDQHKRN